MPAQHYPSKPAPHRPTDLTLNTPLRALPHFPINNDRIHLNAEEWNVLALVLQYADAAQIVAKTDYDADQVLSIIGQLMARGLVTIPGSPISPEPQAESSRSEQSPMSSSATKLNRAILRRLEQSERTV